MHRSHDSCQAAAAGLPGVCWQRCCFCCCKLCQHHCRWCCPEGPEQEPAGCPKDDRALVQALMLLLHEHSAGHGPCNTDGQETGSVWRLLWHLHTFNLLVVSSKLASCVDAGSSYILPHCVACKMSQDESLPLARAAELSCNLQGSYYLFALGLTSPADEQTSTLSNEDSHPNDFPLCLDDLH